MNYNHWDRIGLVFCLDQCSQVNELNYSHTQCPFYLNLDNEERIYFSSRDKNNISRVFYIKIKACDQSITLTENKIYGPIIDRGNKDDFDSDGAMISWILKLKNDYLLYYTGWKVKKKFPYENSIGLCVSRKNSDSFKKIKTNPIIYKNKHDIFFTGTSCVINFKNIFFNYYMSCSEWITNPKTSRKEPKYCLKIATSKDSLNWKITNKVAIPLQGDWGGVSKASVVNIRGKLHMWFSYRGEFHYRLNKDQSYKIGYATSKNGYDWLIEEFSMNADNNQSGDDLMQAYPHVFQKNNKLFMLYNGNEFGKSGIFLAQSKNELI